jgi:hypothetical protein
LPPTPSRLTSRGWPDVAADLVKQTGGAIVVVVDAVDAELGLPVEVGVDPAAGLPRSSRRRGCAVPAAPGPLRLSINPAAFVLPDPHL